MSALCKVSIQDIRRCRESIDPQDQDVGGTSKASRAEYLGLVWLRAVTGELPETVPPDRQTLIDISAQPGVLRGAKHARRDDGLTAPRLEERRLLAIAAQLPPQHEPSESKNDERQGDSIGGNRGGVPFRKLPKGAHLNGPKLCLQRAIP